MAKAATSKTNEPKEEDVRTAVENIEEQNAALASERGIYMQKCKKIRDIIAQDYDNASDRGISKKLLKSIIKERELERRITGLSDDLEPDERTEREMLFEKLGPFAETPLGKAAMAKAEGASTLKTVAG